MPNDINIKIKQHLRQARLRCGLDQKQAAFLLGQSGAHQISRYESGERMPGLLTALKMELVYHTPIRILFEPLCEQFQSDVINRRKRLKKFFPPENHSAARAYSDSDYCFYAQLLKDYTPDSAERRLITQHIVTLMKTLTAAEER